MAIPPNHSPAVPNSIPNGGAAGAGEGEGVKVIVINLASEIGIRTAEARTYVLAIPLANCLLVGAISLVVSVIAANAARSRVLANGASPNVVAWNPTP
ncbi:hypothetical protein NCCP1664_25100 [Zafaria cholistanensis]|uniref:Uncharacterized protein n=1 Tax=Zafaria cholistanensis TaxID=1682741 RepID=A0A5A7NT32_9MICC|nr:hypothetical protein NCCP1664_25100 [Zafaria cholistanensis]